MLCKLCKYTLWKYVLCKPQQYLHLSVEISTCIWGSLRKYRGGLIPVPSSRGNRINSWERNNARVMQVQKSPIKCSSSWLFQVHHIYTCSNIHLLKDAKEIKLRKLNKLQYLEKKPHQPWLVFTQVLYPGLSGIWRCWLLWRKEN